MANRTPKIDLTPELTERIQKWNDAKISLGCTKLKENELRLSLAASDFWSDKKEGSQSVALENGWKLALTRVLNYGIDDVDHNTVVAVLNQLALANPGACQSLIPWKPVLSVEAYRLLTDDEKKIVAPIITIKPGTPQLELKPPPKSQR